MEIKEINLEIENIDRILEETSKYGVTDIWFDERYKTLDNYKKVLKQYKKLLVKYDNVEQEYLKVGKEYTEILKKYQKMEKELEIYKTKTLQDKLLGGTNGR